MFCRRIVWISDSRFLRITYRNIILRSFNGPSNHRPPEPYTGITRMTITAYRL